MRQLRLTIWHLLLIVAIIIGSLTGVLTGVQAFLPAWQTPWLMPLLALVAADAVLTQWLVERERQGWSEQVVIRGVEATLLVVAARIASLAAEGAPLPTIATWLRDPLAFFSGRWSEYVLLAVGTWIVATMLAHRAMQLDTEPPHTGVSKFPIDQAVLLNERAAALLRFDRLWTTLAVLGVTGAVVALFRTPLLDVLGSWASLQLLVSVLGCVLAGVLLHSEGQLDYLRFRWQIEQLEIAPAVAQRWRRTTWLLAGGAIVLALMLGGTVSNVPAPPPLIPVLNLLLGLLVLITWLIIGLVSLLLLPLAWLISLLRGDETAPPAPRFVPPQLPPVEQVTADRPLLPALIFWGCIVLLLTLAVLRYLQQRSDVRALLNRWRGWRWLAALWRRAASDLRGWGELALDQLQRLRRPRRSIPVQRAPVRGTRAQLRALYRRMVRLGTRRGVQYGVSQTPYEWSSRLRAEMPTIDEEAQGLTDAYVAAEYGPVLPNNTELRQARRWWRHIERVLGRRR